MTTVGSYEAKTHLARLLEQVERGEVVTITKHGRAVARLVPVRGGSVNTADVIAQLRAARVGVIRGKNSIRKMIDEGRR